MMGNVLLGFLASGLAGLATGVGALPVLVGVKVGERALDGLLGFAAGVMLAATAFSLLVPSMELGGVGPAVVGLLLGACFVWLADRLIPHLHPDSGLEGLPSHLRRVWLLILAITIHNMPEGLSVGVNFGGGRIAEGTTVALAIGIQNMPEGLAVALPLLREGYSRWRALLLATFTGLAEPPMGFLGAATVALMMPLLPWALAFAAGAMLYVVSGELIPESHARGHQKEATFGAVFGFAIMMFLDNLFGG